MACNVMLLLLLLLLVAIHFYMCSAFMLIFKSLPFRKSKDFEVGSWFVCCFSPRLLFSISLHLLQAGDGSTLCGVRRTENACDTFPLF